MSPVAPTAGGEAAVPPRSEAGPAPAAGRRAGTVRLLLLAVLALVPLRLLQLGYLPPDDALRHAAFAVQARPWTDLLLLRPEITPGYDSHPGWHTLLRVVHQATGADPAVLVGWSVLSLFVAACAAGLAVGRRPEVFLLALLAAAWLEPGFALRFLFGRPFLLTVAAGWVWWAVWERATGRDGADHDRLRPGEWGAAGLAVAVSVWCHSTWFLWALPLAALLPAGRGRLVGRFAVAAAVGLAVGSCATGRPLAYLADQWQHVRWSMEAGAAGAGALAAELRPFTGRSPLLLATLAVVAFSHWRGVGRDRWRHPAAVLTVGAFLLGFRSVRFWTDWGFPSAVIWLGLLLQDWLDHRPLPRRWARPLPLVAAAALALTLAADRQHRWSAGPGRAVPALAEHRSALVAALPPGPGIIYGTDQRVFYFLFLLFPEAPWRYAPGFEPGLLPPDDLAVYRAWRASGDLRRLQPWAERLGPADRLVVLNQAEPAAALPGLRWERILPGCWVGRAEAE